MTENEEELRPKRRGRPPKVKEEVVATAEPPVIIDQPGLLEEFDAIFGDELTPESERDLEEMLAAQAANGEIEGIVDGIVEQYGGALKALAKPTRDKFVNMN